MRIDIDAVPPRGRAVAANTQSAWAVAATERAMDATPTLLELDWTVYQIDGGARVRGPAEVEVSRSCDRCGGDLSLRLEGDVDLRYVPDAHTGPDGVELESAELDVGWFDGHSLDLGDVWSEQLALWLPGVVRCDSAGVSPVDPSRPCRVPVQDPGPALKRRNPFAGIVLPE